MLTGLFLLSLFTPAPTLYLLIITFLASSFSSSICPLYRSLTPPHFISFLPSHLPSFLPSFPSSIHPSFLPAYSTFSSSFGFLPSFLPTFFSHVPHPNPIYFLASPSLHHTKFPTCSDIVTVSILLCTISPSLQR